MILAARVGDVDGARRFSALGGLFFGRPFLGRGGFLLFLLSLGLLFGFRLRLLLGLGFLLRLRFSSGLRFSLGLSLGFCLGFGLRLGLGFFLGLNPGLLFGGGLRLRVGVCRRCARSLRRAFGPSAGTAVFVLNLRRGAVTRRGICAFPSRYSAVNRRSRRGSARLRQLRGGILVGLTALAANGCNQKHRHSR